MGKKKAKASPMFILGLTIVFGLGSAWAFWSAWSAARLSWADQPSTCEVLATRVESSSAESDGSNERYYPVVELAHSVDGQRYTRADSGPTHLMRIDAREEIRDLRVGQSVDCLYIAGSPADVVYFEERDGQIYGMLVFGSLLLVLPVVAFLFERRKPGWPKRKRKG